MDAFDAVVVGAGHNGLAAAIHLLNRGWSVVVVEQAGEPGGAVKTREITLPGFRHDLCAMNLSLFAGRHSSPPIKTSLRRRASLSRPRPTVSRASFATTPILASARISRRPRLRSRRCRRRTPRPGGRCSPALARRRRTSLACSVRPCRRSPPRELCGPHGAPKARNRFSISAVSCLRAHAISWTRISNRRRSRR